jgi:hypothetical protein
MQFENNLPYITVRMMRKRIEDQEVYAVVVLNNNGPLTSKLRVQEFPSKNKKDEYAA